MAKSNLTKKLDAKFEGEIKQKEVSDICDFPF
jgi:hypothetical protein